MITSFETRLMQDREILHNICCEAYSQNFYHHWEIGGLENYLDDVFGMDVLKREFMNEKIQY